MATFIIYTEQQGITVGQRTQFAAKNADGPVTWTSSNPDVANIDRKTGLATGLKQSSSPVTITGTDRGNNTATAKLWVGSLTVSPQVVGMDAGDSVTFSVRGQSVTWSSSATAVATIDQNGKATVDGLGATLITARNANGDVGYATLHGGTLLVYGADGTLYMVPAQLWSVARIDPPQESGVPTFGQMNTKPQQSSRELVQYVPPSPTWTTCYVLNPWPLKPSGSSGEQGPPPARR